MQSLCTNVLAVDQCALSSCKRERGAKGGKEGHVEYKSLMNTTHLSGPTTSPDSGRFASTLVRITSLSSWWGHVAASFDYQRRAVH